MKQSWRRFRPKTQLLPKSWRDRINFGSKYLIGFFLLVILVVGIFVGYRHYLNNTNVVAAAGGTLIEGMAGQPKLINPILSQTNDVDRDIAKLIFSSLLTFDQNRNLVGELAEKWEVSEDQKSYTVYLRQNIKWHDGENFTADDVAYTFNLIQDKKYPGTLADNWRDVAVEKIDNYTVKFTLPDVFSPFLVNLTTGILPYHILKDTPVDQIDKIDFNIRPIGTGPYKINTIKYDRAQNKYNSFELVAFDDYFLQKPYITNIAFKFYSTYQELYQAYNAHEINSISRVLTADWPMVNNTTTNIKFYDIALPQYSAIFINQDGKSLLRDPYVKEAMAYSLNRDEILQNILNGKGNVVDTPVLDGFIGHNPDIIHIYQDQDKARALLEAGKWADIDGDGIREKDGTRLTIKLVTSDNPDFVLTANLIKKYWQEIGIDIQVSNYNIGDLEDNFIETRNYDCILFGENLGQDPDPYPYWHSSQIENPGLNLSQYANIEIDKYLEEGRHSNDADTRIHSYLPFQEVIFDDKPAIFLIQPFYVYAASQSIQGINVNRASSPSDRFQTVSDWFINTKRVWKN